MCCAPVLAVVMTALPPVHPTLIARAMTKVSAGDGGPVELTKRLYSRRRARRLCESLAEYATLFRPTQWSWTNPSHEAAGVRVPRCAERRGGGSDARQSGRRGQSARRRPE